MSLKPHRSHVHMRCSMWQVPRVTAYWVTLPRGSFWAIAKAPDPWLADRMQRPATTCIANTGKAELIKSSSHVRAFVRFDVLILSFWTSGVHFVHFEHHGPYNCFLICSMFDIFLGQSVLVSSSLLVVSLVTVLRYRCSWENVGNSFL